jgi:hypothetical protein
MQVTLCHWLKILRNDSLVSFVRPSRQKTQAINTVFCLPEQVCYNKGIIGSYTYCQAMARPNKYQFVVSVAKG